MSNKSNTATVSLTSTLSSDSVTASSVKDKSDEIIGESVSNDSITKSLVQEKLD